VVLGITIGLGLLIKHSLIVLAPISIALLLGHGIWRKIKYKEHLCRYLNLGLLVTCCFYLLLIAGYAFDAGFIDDDEASFISDWFHFTGDFADSFQSMLVHLPVLLPKYYLYGMDMVMNDVQNGRPTFILGQVLDKGVWYYFPIAFVLKTSLPFLIVTIAGLVWTAVEIVRRKWLDGLYLLLPPLIYLALSMNSHLNIGIRHIMPVFPFFAAMGAGAITRFSTIRNRPGEPANSSAAQPLAKRRGSASPSE
jgi:4-amino-4-deoxy-L-arabinose transferase-like glycosyltransferase